MESTQHILDNLRPPRVHITYDVEIGDAIEVIELPFVVGVMADLSGDNNANLIPLSQRKFVEVDGDTFGKIMEASLPHVTFNVPNLLKNDGSLLDVNLNFSSLDDFGPVSVAKQQPDLAALYAVRENLSELLSRISSNEDLSNLLEQISTNPTQLATLKKLVAPSTSASTSKPAAKSASDPKPSAKK